MSNFGGSPATGGEEKVLTSGYERLRHMFYSPDGRWIYVQPSTGTSTECPPLVDRYNGSPTFLSPVFFLEEPMISPDGRWLA